MRTVPNDLPPFPRVARLDTTDRCRNPLDTEVDVSRATAVRPGKKVLVIEDDAAIRDAMILILEMEGYQVAGAANGREALDYLERAERPSLILLDLMMPVMDGWQFRRQQRRDSRLADIPVVIISAAGTIGEKAAALEADGFLQKPVDVDELLATVGRHCERRPGQPRSARDPGSA